MGLTPSTECISPEEKRQVLARILESKEFQRAAKLREFLRFVCERSIDAGSSAAAREQDIGTAVYQRKDHYNASEDNIVRVEARNLRQKLDNFYSGEGSELPIIIRIPKGAYVPEFERRTAPRIDPPPPSPVAPVPPPVVRGGVRGGRLAVGFLVLALVFLSAMLWVRNMSLQARLASARPENSGGPLWSSLFDTRHNTYLVLADSGFVTVQDLLKRRLSLSDYMKREPGKLVHFSEPPSEAERAAEIAGSPVLTSVTGARFVASVFGLPGIDRSRLSIRSARDMGPLDFKGNHVILIGNIRSDPWVEMFELKLNFRHEFDFARSQAVIRNVSPRPGELPDYWVGGINGRSTEIYSTVALLPNLSHDGSVLIVSGTGTEGTESACEMLFNPELASLMIKRLGLGGKGRTQFFELLLKSTKLGTTSNGVEIVAYRMLPD